MPAIDTIYQWLEAVKDPEIPVLSLVDMGIITDIQTDGNKVTITITPTFVGCPALDLMKQEIEENLKGNGVEEVVIQVSFREPWTTDRISAKGRRALKQFGLAPPPATTLFSDIDILEHAVCPRCGETNTEMKTPFGPTLCRSIHYCLTCKEAFEQFKPL